MQYADGGSFTFPRGLTTPKEVDLHVGRTGDSIATRLHDGIVAHIAERGLRNVALEYRIRLVLDELVKNVVFHDMLGLQGNEVETIWDAARTNEAMLPGTSRPPKGAKLGSMSRSRMTFLQLPSNCREASMGLRNVGRKRKRPRI